ATESDEKLKKVPVGGGPAITLASDVQNGHASASWGDDGFIVYASAGFGLSRVSGSGGQSELASDTSTSDEGIFWPQVLPGGRGVLAQHCRNRCAQHDLTLLDLDTRQLTVLVEGATRGWYLPTGYLLYATQEGALYAAPFDLGKRAITGAAVPLLDNVRSGISNATRLAVSPAGTIAYLGGAANAGDLVVAQVDRAGREEVLISRAGSYDLPRLSPEGERIGLVIPVENRNQIWVYDIPSATLSQLTFEGTNSRPSWSPDGTRLVFASDRSGNWDLWWAPADGSGPGERVAEGPDVTSAMVTSWSRDGKWIVFDGVAEGDSGVAVQEDVFAVPTTGKRIRQLAVGTPADEQSGVVSPDGRWIAYNSDESGTTQVYVRPFLVPGGRGLISTGRGSEPVWVSNQELAYRDGDNDSLTVAILELGARIRVLRRTALFDYSRYRMGNPSWQGYDVSRDGKRFLVTRSVEVQADPEPIVVLNWFAEVRRRFAEQGARR
ncbi:MAG: hypothetical protein OEV95_13710, partial [Gemmatimonadota bacterium]|nr:hypothetical protein [Gemmatimonadota bacterium]